MGPMAARKEHPIAQGIGLVCLIAGFVALGFALGMARPRQALVTTPSAPPDAGRRGQ